MYNCQFKFAIVTGGKKIKTQEKQPENQFATIKTL